MNFKKDYLNYLIHNILKDNGPHIRDKIILKKIFEKIILADDLAKITYLIGKTSGFEILFKYFLYISDKIDKSQITIFNLKDNLDYDVKNLKKICYNISVKEKDINKISETKEILKTETPEEKDILEEVMIDELINNEKIEKEIGDNSEIPEDSKNETIELEQFVDNIHENELDESGMTLIENKDNDTYEEELFEITDLEDVSNSELPEEEAIESEDEDYNHTVDDNETEEGDFAETNFGKADIENEKTVLIDRGNDNLVTNEKTLISDTEEEDIEVSLRKEEELEYSDAEIEYNETKDETVTNEAYYRFENKFFEEVKIMEKLFQNIERDVRLRPLIKINEKSIQSFTEIIEISSELSHLSRQLPFDIPSNVFFTINLFFTKAFKIPHIVSFQRMKLLSNALLLVTSLIKGKSENYLNDDIIKQIESLKEDLLSRQPFYEKHDYEKQPQEPKEIPQEELFDKKPHPMERLEKKKDYVTNLFTSESSLKRESFNIQKQDDQSRNANDEKINIEMKLHVRYFEKTYNDILNLQGEYSKFEALDKIDELNQFLIQIAKLSASIRLDDITRLSEVSYVFLKYLKDYRLDLTTDVEAQRNINYIIFTYKMLLTNRKPEDFNIVVEYLNNPEKIFTDN